MHGPKNKIVQRNSQISFFYMCYIRDTLFETDVDKKGCDLQSVSVSWEIIPAAFHSSYRQ